MTHEQSPARRSFAARIVLACALAALSWSASAQPPSDELAIAVANERVAEVRALLGRGADPNTRDAGGEPVLIAAARGGSVATVEVLLAGRADVGLRNRFGDTALMIAALNGHLEVVK